LQQMTHSHLRDLGGPVDWLVLIGVAVLGAVGLAILVYTAQSLLWRPAREEVRGRAARAVRSAPVVREDS